MSEQIAEIIKQAREAKGLTQSQVADFLEIGLRAYQHIEAGRFPKYKSEPIRQIEQLLGINIYDKIYTGTSLATPQILESSQKQYITQRRDKKNSSDPFTVPLVPIKAQAGYTKSYDQAVFIDTLEKYAIPPGITYHGAIWRYWEIEGDSMEPTFNNKDIILTSQVHRLDWENLRNFYIYVIVTNEKVLIKRVFVKPDDHENWVLISDNEDAYPQQLLKIQEVNEVWVFRRHIDSKAPVPKQFEIKV